MQGTKPSRSKGTQSEPEPVFGVDQNATTQEPPQEPLSRKEINAMSRLGWKKPDYASFTPAECRVIIAAGKKKAGSKAAVNSETNNILGGAPASLASDKPKTDRPREGGLRVRVDDYEMRCVTGEYPIDQKQIEIQEAYDKQFGPGVIRVRAINPNLPSIPGPAFQPVYDEDNKLLTEADLTYGIIREDVYQEHYVQNNIKRSQRLMGKVDEEKDDSAGDDAGGPPLGLNPNDPYYSPAFGPGAKLGRGQGAAA